MGASRSADVRGNACAVFKRALLHRSTAGAEHKWFEADDLRPRMDGLQACTRMRARAASGVIGRLGRCQRHEALLVRDTISPKRASSEEGTGFPFAVNLCGVGPTCMAERC